MTTLANDLPSMLPAEAGATRAGCEAQASTSDDDRIGPFLVVVDYEKSVSEHATLGEAREAGRKACDAEPLPSFFSIMDAGWNHVEDIQRSDCASLAAVVARFNAEHAGR